MSTKKDSPPLWQDWRFWFGLVGVLGTFYTVGSMAWSQYSARASFVVTFEKSPFTAPPTRLSNVDLPEAWDSEAASEYMDYVKLGAATRTLATITIANRSLPMDDVRILTGGAGRAIVTRTGSEAEIIDFKDVIELRELQIADSVRLLIWSKVEPSKFKPRLTHSKGQSILEEDGPRTPFHVVLPSVILFVLFVYQAFSQYRQAEKITDEVTTMRTEESQREDRMSKRLRAYEEAMETYKSALAWTKEYPKDVSQKIQAISRKIEEVGESADTPDES